jgi:hypothetical protein
MSFLCGAREAITGRVVSNGERPSVAALHQLEQSPQFIQPFLVGGLRDFVAAELERPLDDLLGSPSQRDGHGFDNNNWIAAGVFAIENGAHIVQVAQRPQSIGQDFEDLHRKAKHTVNVFLIRHRAFLTCSADRKSFVASRQAFAHPPSLACMTHFL